MYSIDLILCWGIGLAQFMLCGLIDKEKAQLVPPITTLILCKRLVKDYFNLIKGRIRLHLRATWYILCVFVGESGRIWSAGSIRRFTVN
jgi:hypothetical protein